MKSLVVILAALCATSLRAQPCMLSPTGKPVFSCTGYYIIEDSSNSILAACDKQLTICLGTPIPTKHPQSPVDSPVHLYAGYYDDDGSFIKNEIHCSLSFDNEHGFLIVTPDTFPVSVMQDPYPIRYEIDMDCRYFDGPDATTKAQRFFSKQNVVRAYAIPRALRDSTDLSASVWVSPSKVSVVSYVIDGVDLMADGRNGRWMFDHWSSSVPITGLNAYDTIQTVVDGCWPLQDTVVFTAWYRDALSLVYENNISFTPAIHFNSLANTVEIQDEPHSKRIWEISDLQGRILYRISDQNSLDSQGNYQISLDGISGAGLLFILGIGENSVVTMPLFTN